MATRLDNEALLEHVMTPGYTSGETAQAMAAEILSLREQLSGERAARAQAERERDEAREAHKNCPAWMDVLRKAGASEARAVAAEAALAELRLANTSLAEALAEAKAEWHPDSLRAQWDKHKRIAEENKALTAALAEARAEAERLRGLLVECAATLGCGERDEDGWDSGHWCTHCDDFVDRNMVLRRRIDAALASPAAEAEKERKP